MNDLLTLVLAVAAGILLFASICLAVALLIIGAHRVQRRHRIRELYDDEIWAQFTKSWPLTVAAGEYIRDTYGRRQVKRLLHDPDIKRYVLDAELALRPATRTSINKRIDAAARAAGIRKVTL